MDPSDPAIWQQDANAALAALKARMSKKGSKKSVFRSESIYFGIGEDPFANAAGIGKLAPGDIGFDANIGWATPIGGGLFGASGGWVWSEPTGELLNNAANLAGS